MRLTLRAFTMALAALFVLTAPVLATWNDVGIAPRAISMGQAQAAAATDSSAVMYNPAALVQAREQWELEGSDIWVQYSQIGYAPVLTVNGVDQNYWFIAAASIGAMIPIGKRVTFGFQVLNPSNVTLTLVPMHGPAFDRYQPQRRPVGGLGIGIKITDKFSIGVAQFPTVNFNGNKIPIDLGSIVGGTGLSLGDPNVDMPPQIEVDAITGASYSFGALLKPVKYISLGFAYKYRNNTQLHIPVFFPPGLLPEATLVVESFTEVHPTQMMFGMALFPNDNLTVAFDMVYSLWSREKPYSRVLSSDPNVLNKPFPDVELDDTWDPRVGFEWKDDLWGKLSRADYSIRAGYSFSKSPFPASDTENTVIDNDAHFISGGFSLGYKPRKRLDYISFDYFFQYIDMVERVHKDLKRNPAVVVSDGYVIYYGAGITVKL